MDGARRCEAAKRGEVEAARGAVEGKHGMILRGAFGMFGYHVFGILRSIRAMRLVFEY